MDEERLPGAESARTANGIPGNVHGARTFIACWVSPRSCRGGGAMAFT